MNRIAHRYALALLGLAEQLSMLDSFSEDMRCIEEAVRGSRELKRLLNTPIVTPDRKLKVLDEIFAKAVTPQTMSFVKLLVEKGRSMYLFDTAEEFLHMIDQRRGIVRARIASAHSLSDEQKMLVQAKLERMTGKRIRAEFMLDPTVRGGFVARIGDEMIDASLAHQLEVLREQFKHGSSPVLN